MIGYKTFVSYSGKSKNDKEKIYVQFRKNYAVESKILCGIFLLQSINIVRIK